MTIGLPEALQHMWTLVEMDINGTLQSVPSECSITLQFEGESRVHGKSTCNRYFSTYTVNGSEIRFGAAGATRMMCPEPLMVCENAYFAALKQVASYQVEDEVLMMYNNAGKSLLRFRPT